jgi:putative flippase GtrA
VTALPPLRRLATFATVGAGATVGYAVIAGGLAWLGVATLWASLIAYGLCACWSYFGHKRFTFASSGAHRVEAPRFVVATAAGLAVAAATPILFARLFGPSPWAAVLATCLLVPVISYVAAESFVFRKPA